MVYTAAMNICLNTELPDVVNAGKNVEVQPKPRKLLARQKFDRDKLILQLPSSIAFVGNEADKCDAVTAVRIGIEITLERKTRFIAPQFVALPGSDAAQTKKGFVKPGWIARRVPTTDQANCEIVQHAMSAAFLLRLPSLTGASQERSGAAIPIIRKLQEIQDGDEIAVFD